MGIKRNFAYSAILTSANYVFPMLVFPYISRVLGVENVGICNFIDSIVNYFVMFSTMGVATLGIREIAACHGSGERSRVFSSLVALNAIFTLVAVVGMVVVTYTMEAVAAYRELMFIGILKLVSNFLLLEWLYKGVEDFGYITKRTLVVKCAYVASVFLLVRDAGDYMVYYLLTTLMITVNSVINIIHSRKIAAFAIRGVSLRKYLVPFLSLGYYMLLTTMYNSFNVTFLGFVASKSDVGNFSTAVKLFAIIIALYTAYSNVVMPRMSSLVGNGDRQGMQSLVYKSISGLLMFALPTSVFLLCYAEQVVSILFGSEYVDMVIILRMIAPLLIVVGYEQILVMQVIMPNKKDKGLTYCSTIGAAVGIALNVALVPSLTYVGSSLAWMASEMVVMVIGQCIVSRNNLFTFPVRSFAKHVLVYVPLLAICYCLNFWVIGNGVLSFVVGVVMVCVYTIVAETRVVRNEMALLLCRKLKICKSDGR